MYLGLELGKNQFCALTQERYRLAAGRGYMALKGTHGVRYRGVFFRDVSELAAFVGWTI